MDLATARASLPVMTHAAMGAPYDILPMVEGKMGAGQADPGRDVQVWVMGRFDLGPGLDQLGGGRADVTHAKFVSAHATISFARATLTWIPGEGDRIARHGSTEVYRVTHALETAAGTVVCALMEA
jgi:hypothetical protein